MSLNKKVFTYLLLTLTGILVVTFTLIYFLFLNSFVTIENDKLTTNAQRVQDVFKSKIDEMNVKLSDWSNWDDTYDFVKTLNPKYIESNLGPNNFVNLNINSLLFYDSFGKLKYGVYVDLKTNKPIPVPQDIENYLNQHFLQFLSFSKNGTSNIGVISVSDTHYLIAARPITSSDGTATPSGTIVFLREIDSSIVNQIANISHNLVTATQFKQVDFDTNKIHVKTISSNLQQAHFVIKDLENQPTLLFTISQDRPIYNLALKTMITFLAILAASSLIKIFTIFRILNFNVLTPLNKFIDSLANIANSNNYGVRLPNSNSQEFQKLTNSLNTMLSQLDKSKTLLEEKVTYAENTNRAMINILEDERDLQNQLKKQRDEAQILISSMGEALLVIDTHGRITAINPVAEKLLETNSSSAIGRTWTELVTTLKGDSVTPLQDRAFSQVIFSGKTVITTLEDDHYYITPSGKKFPIISTTAPITNGDKITGAIKVFKDATPEKEQKHTIENMVILRTQELQEEKARLTASIINLPIGFVLTDAKGAILISNPSAEKILHLNAFPTHLSELETHVQVPLQEYLQTCCNTKTPIEVKEYTYGPQTLHLFISPIIVHTHDESCIGSAIIIEDITESKVLERSRNEFFSIASHELRTPLTAIRGNTSMILQYFSEKLEPQVMEMIKDVEEGSTRLIGIVNDFLDISRLEQGKIEYKKIGLDLADLIPKVLADFHATSTQSNVDIKFDPIPNTSLPQVLADPDRVRQVLTNLIGNALKFTQNGSITLSLSQKGSQIETSVTDTGHGIPLENQKFLFHKFQQAGSSLYTRDTTKGTGLGLYISKLIVEAQGGQIYLSHSEPEKGSTFAFTLPILSNQ